MTLVKRVLRRAQRWANSEPTTSRRGGLRLFSAGTLASPLDASEREALLGWVRRRLEAVTMDGPAEVVVPLALADVVLALGLTAKQGIALHAAAVEGWRHG